MKFTIENQYISGAVVLMQQLPLAGYQSMARTRFIRVLKDQVKSLEDARKDLFDEFGEKDKDGKLIVENDSYKLKDGKSDEFQDAYTKLMTETGEVDKATYTDHKADIQDVLKNCKLELSGDDATIYAALCDALDVTFDDKKGDK
ncbi:hypothetical protein C5Z25_01510 [Lactobacillus sp. CBA3605]|uniref:DUF1617 family protein n=1 Tax=Lactobacillus sp. CBA3605 TaxID=2099788 RepID=UPI000CFBAABB|nr:DUF1617 family protein [Lactobacillus sp. CBA3605]AVK60526.1 hypothetical protein C5Z25_01510 [Lactobacillus sp. CBA3605]